MSMQSLLRKLGLSAVLAALAMGCVDPSDVTLDVPPTDVFETITGDGWFDGFIDLMTEIEDDIVCIPACEGTECGDDGCNGTACGKCAQDLVCIDFVCVPDCDAACEGLECGPAGGDGECDCGVCDETTPAPRMTCARPASVWRRR